MFFFIYLVLAFFFFFFFNDTATTEIYTLSLHDALPIWISGYGTYGSKTIPLFFWPSDRKSTRLNSSHQLISYAVFCLKKKKKQQANHRRDTDWERVRNCKGANGIT